MNAACRIELLGTLRVEQDGRSITRFRTHKTAVLLAYLAFYRDTSHPRETLTELLWPECDPDAGRNSLSKALGSLRNQLEPPGVPSGAILLADRSSIQLNPVHCTTDVAAFQAAIRAAHSKKDTQNETISKLAVAADLYGGELLPGFYEDWNLAERSYLAESCLDSLHQLVALLERVGDLRRAREYAHRAVALDPLREEAHQSLLLLSLADGDPASAVRQYREWERLSLKDLGSAPSPELRVLVAPWLKSASIPLAPSPAPVALPPAFPANSLSVDALPSQTVTLLLAEASGRDADPAWEQIVRRHGGFFPPELYRRVPTAVFGHATEAASCAAALQHRTKPQGDLRLALQTVEMGGATGWKLLEAQGVHLLTAAHPGQVLCTESTAALLRRDPEPGRQIVDLGLYRLTGERRTERLFDMLYPERPAGIPAMPQAEPASKTTLPLQMTRFFGREAEMAHLLGQIERSRDGEGERLWTLTGPGGMGKTRLSLELAQQSMTTFAGAVWFVPLAEITDTALIMQAVLEVIGVAPSPGTDPLPQAAQALSERPTLLILDNFEQFVGPTQPDIEAVAVILRLLQLASTLTCVVTSRHRLGVVGEREFPLSPLPTPASAAPLDLLTGCESVRLFIDRAQAVRPDFQLTSGNAAAVAGLCERLEGLPLALELAAARAQVLTPAQMLKQLDRRFDFLVSRQRSFALRHRTIRATIDWSYGLLTPEMRRFAGLLSVFRGGWSLAAAESVTKEVLSLDFLEQLVDCSLVLADTGEVSGEMRYRQLETLRQYAEEGLTVPKRTALRVRHAAYFLSLATDAELHLQGPELGEWLVRLEGDHDNFRAALEYCLEVPDQIERGLDIATALWRFWHVRGHVREGRERLGRLLAVAELRGCHENSLSAARIAAGILARYQNDHEAARTLLLPGLAWARAHSDYPRIALTLYHLGLVELSLNRRKAGQALLEESLDIGRAHGDQPGIAAALSSLAIVASESGDFPLGQALFTEALSLRRSLGDKQGVATLLFNLGNLALLQSDYSPAQALFEESLVLRRELGDRWGIASLLNSLGLQLSNQGEYLESRGLLEEGLSLFREVGDKQGIAVCLGNLGTVALMTGDANAREMLSESLILRWQLGDKVDVAFALEALMRLEAVSGDAARAVTLWAVIEALREAIRVPRPPHAVVAVEQAVAAARAALSADAFAAAQAQGQRLELEQVLALLLDGHAPLRVEKIF